MARSVTRIKHSSKTRTVARPAQGNHTNDDYPGRTIPAGGDNVRTTGVRNVDNNQKRRVT